MGFQIRQRDGCLKAWKALFFTKPETLLFSSFKPFETRLIEKQKHVGKCSCLGRKTINALIFLPNLFRGHLICWFFQYTSWDRLKSHQCSHYYKYCIYANKSALQYKPMWSWITNCFVFHTGCKTKKHLWGFKNW